MAVRIWDPRWLTMCAVIRTMYITWLISVIKRLRWSRGSVLAFSTQVRGFEPGRSRRIFRAKLLPDIFLAHSSTFRCWDLSHRCGRRHLAAKVETSKGGGKQWQTTPKNLPRMQCARAISVTWKGSGSCQTRPSRLNTNEWISIVVL